MNVVIAVILFLSCSGDNDAPNIVKFHHDRPYFEISYQKEKKMIPNFVDLFAAVGESFKRYSAVRFQPCNQHIVAINVKNKVYKRRL